MYLLRHMFIFDTFCVSFRLEYCNFNVKILFKPQGNPYFLVFEFKEKIRRENPRNFNEM